MTPAALAAARIGEILLAKGLLTREQLQEVLAEQEQTGQRFGEMLLERGLVSRLALASALAEQWATLEGEHVAVADSPAPTIGADGQVAAAIEQEWQALRAHRPIGEIFVSAGLITQEQLERALEEQKRTGQRLGEVLVSHGAVSRLELASALAEQWDERPQLRVAGDAQAPIAPPPRPVLPPPPPAPLVVEAPSPEPAPVPAEPEVEAHDDRLDAIEGRLILLESDRRVTDLAEREQGLEATTRELESRIAELEQLSSSGHDGDGRIEALAAELAELRDAISTLRAGAGAEEISTAFEGRIAPIDERLTSFGHAVEALGTDLRASIELLSERFAGETERLERLARESAAPARRGDEDELSERVRALELTIGEIREAGNTLGTTVGSAVELLRDRLEHETARIEQLATERLESLADAPTVELGPVEERIAALERAVADGEIAGRLEELAKGLAELASSLAEGDAAHAEVAERLARLDAQIATHDGIATDVADLREALANELRRQESALTARVVAVVEEEVRLHGEAARGDVEALRAEQERRLHDAAASLAGRLDALEEQARQLDEGDRSDELAARLAELSHESTATRARLEALVDERARLAGEVAAAFAERLDLFEVQARQRDEGDRSDELVAQLAELRAAFATELSEQQSRLQSLLEERARVVGEAAAALTARLDALEEQVQQRDEGDRSEELAAQLAELSAQSAATGARLETLVEERARLAGEVAASFAERLDVLEVRARKRDEGDRSEELAAELATLRRELAELREHGANSAVRLEEQIGSFDDAAATRAAELRVEQERALGEARAALESRLATLEEHLAQSTIEADRRDAATSARLEERANELQEVLSEGIRQHIEQLQAAQARALLEVATELEAKLDELATRSGEDAERSARLSAGLDELRAAVGRLGSRLGDGEQALEATLERLDGLSSRNAAAQEALGATLSGHVRELEAQLVELRQADEGIADAAHAGLAELRGELDSARADARQAAATLHERFESFHSEQERAAQELSAQVEARVARADELAAERARELEARIDAQFDAGAAEVAVRLAAFDDARARLEAELQASLEEALGRFGARLETSEQVLAKTAKQVEGWLVELGERQQAAQDALADVFENRAAELDAKVDALAETDVRVASELRAAVEEELDRIAARLLESEETLGSAAQWLSARVDSVEERSVAAEGAIARVDGTVGSLSTAVDGLHGRIEGHMAAALAALAGWRSAEAGRHAPPTEPSPEPKPAVEAEPAPASEGFFAFVPSANGYRLVKCDGTPPPVGDELDLPGVSGRLTVAKLGASPLSADRRPCAYLELASAGPDESDDEARQVTQVE